MTQRKPWSTAPDKYRLPLPMGKTFQTVSIDKIYWLACRAVTLQKKFDRYEVTPLRDELQPRKALITKFMSDAQGSSYRNRPAGLLPGGRIIVAHWTWLIKFYTIDGKALLPEITYDGLLVAIDWTTSDNGGTTTLALIVEGPPRKMIAYSLIYTVTARNKERLNIKKVIEIVLPPNGGNECRLSLREPYVVVLEGRSASVTVADWVTGRNFQFTFNDTHDRNRAIKRIGIHPTEPQLIFQFMTYHEGIWIETLSNIDDFLLPEPKPSKSLNESINSAITFVQQFAETSSTIIIPLYNIARETSDHIFEMVFTLDCRDINPPRLCTISLSLKPSESRWRFHNHGSIPEKGHALTFKTSQGDTVLSFCESPQRLMEFGFDTHSILPDFRDNLRFIFPPYPSYWGWGIWEKKLCLPRRIEDGRRYVIQAVDNIHGFALVWTIQGMWLVKY
ncbi:hypothetical protein SISNIDRAFT_550362 [Sistotremastrum niveocremeum HHB9708]|uniref:Uncharacterized protein n=1 Tax=Sistotremastrum niveocremeum HHB9708 TaxID=1314777 RepID=A0A164U2B3_9AGAM|nr:hypothetical protein SISNIDRAFT_550362 [Sistotremastrum niveocremeum HHB9708]